MGVLKTVIAVFLIAFVPAAASAQRVTKVPSGDTLVVSGVGKVHLLGIKSADETALHMGPSGRPAQPRQDARTPAPVAVGGHFSLKPDRPSQDWLRKLALGKTVRVSISSVLQTNAGRLFFAELKQAA